MNKYLLTAEADEDLGDIWDHIAQDNPDAADRLEAKLRSAFEMLASNPGAGHSRKDLTAISVLFWPVGDYLIIYRAIKECVEILAVVHGSRDVPHFLSERAGG